MDVAVVFAVGSNRVGRGAGEGMAMPDCGRPKHDSTALSSSRAVGDKATIHLRSASLVTRSLANSRELRKVGIFRRSAT